MLTRLVRWQLTTFAVITVISVTSISLFYLKIPDALGIGSYEVTANFSATGGLYQNANVTYRGTTIGRVTAISLAHGGGVDATLRLDSGAKVPESVDATVKSASAIGEQYVELRPRSDASSPALRDGSLIARDHTALSQDVAGMLKQADQLVDSLSNSKLRDLLRETFKAFNGSGPDLARLIESSRLLVDEANTRLPETTALIDQAGPFLDAQIRSGDDIQRIADGLARLTGHVRDADPQIRTLLATAPGAASQVSETFAGIRPSFPMLAANLANFGRIGVIYHKSIEQALVIFPALTAALTTIANQEPLDEGAKTDFKLNLGDPPPCSVGYIPPPQIRSPADETLREVPPGMFCKVAQNDASVVRGARNYPCMEFPGKRAPTVQLCRDPQGYVPLGTNPWRGPTVPYGTPVTDPRMTLPMNKYPYLPPDADYDPGAPVVALPPGVAPGPGPALTPPYPLPVPPNTIAPQPLPLPFQAPTDQTLPPYGQQPPGAPASEPRVDPSSAGSQPQSAELPHTTYDEKSGAFLDPHGGISVYAAGASQFRPAENWVDLMRAPSSS
jgi:phospholipid/cholesterol/gamma-HCH transport system substrate-binding protein